MCHPSAWSRARKPFLRVTTRTATSEESLLSSDVARLSSCSRVRSNPTCPAFVQIPHQKSFTLRALSGGKIIAANESVSNAMSPNVIGCPRSALLNVP